MREIGIEIFCIGTEYQQRQTGLNSNRLRVGINNKILSEGSLTMARFAHWSRIHAHPLGREMTSQRLSELFETVTQDSLENFLKTGIKRSGNEYWFYDTTSISSYSQCLESVRWGKNKDRAPLHQLNIASVLDANSGLPVCFKNIAGNISDVSMVCSLLEDAKQWGVSRMRLCLDRGFYSKADIGALILQLNRRFIGGF